MSSQERAEKRWRRRRMLENKLYFSDLIFFLSLFFNLYILYISLSFSDAKRDSCYSVSSSYFCSLVGGSWFHSPPSLFSSSLFFGYSFHDLNSPCMTACHFNLLCLYHHNVYRVHVTCCICWCFLCVWCMRLSEFHRYSNRIMYVCRHPHRPPKYLITILTNDFRMQKISIGPGRNVATESHSRDESIFGAYIVW